MKKKKSISSLIINIICILVIIGSGVAIFLTLYPKYQESKKYEEIQQVAQIDDLGTIDWDALKAVNPDVVGWISIPNTHINYPVVQTTDNDYYLLHNFNNEYSGYGTPFLDAVYDFERDPVAQNAVIYGHNSRWGDEVGFEGLEEYEDITYFYEHPSLYYTTIYDGNTPVEYEIVGVIKENYDFDYRRPDFADQNDFLTYYNMILSQKLYDTGKGIYANDQLVTLSSCVFDMDNGRVAIIARRVTEEV